ncbi:MAG: Ig-like domain-containing protein [Clostridia bacterium]|nr:Ig-like domain-containing protein [Clostridia bacterium]MDD4386835.1 Ig-like domain-containing protein [Clostridia bacterium]
MIYNGKGKSDVRKIISLILVMVFIITSTFSNFLNISYGATYTDGIDNSFPEEYKQYLRSLRVAHPNWTFTAKNTGLNFNDVINEEMSEGRSLTDQDDAWWRRDNVEVETGWVNASRAAVEYAINPLNFLNEEQIFQFETLEYNASIETKVGVDGILYATPMSILSADGQSYVTIPIKYYDSQGNLKEDLIGKTYSQVIFDAGKNNLINPYHLAARIKLETKADINGNLSINGRYHPSYDSNCIGDYRGLYNYYNIGANGNHPIANALQYAKTPGVYGEPWDNPEKAIIGGALFIKAEYVSKGQNTLYFQKFNVASTTTLYSHQYMTNILAARSEATFIYKTYKESINNTLNMQHEFVIPVYNTLAPSITGIRVYLDDPIDAGVPDMFSVRSQPDVSIPWAANVIKQITFNDDQKQIKDNGIEITRLETGINTYWDKIRIKYLDTGNVVEGYLSSKYVKDLIYPKVTTISVDKTEITLLPNQIQKLNTNITPTDAWYKDVTWSSSNNSVAIVDQSGNITAKSIGNAIITVTSNETGKTSICTVNVIDTNIKLDSTSYTLLKGNTVTIKPVVENSNFTYKVTIDKPEIATIVGNVITGVSAGTATITVTLDGTNKTDTATLTVSNLAADQSIVINPTKVNVNGSEITKINSDTTVSSIKTNDITLNNLNVIFKDINDKILIDTDNVGTGTKMEVRDNSNNLIYTYNVIIYGDISGDGEIDVVDLLMLKRKLTNKLELTYFANRAANISKSNEQPDVTDLLRLKRHLTNKTLIVQ